MSIVVLLTETSDISILLRNIVSFQSCKAEIISTI